MEFPAQLVTKLRDAKRVVVLTGAGVSAESGVPTFRQAQTGLWSRYRPEDLATPQAFRRNPGLVWEWYTWRRELIAGALPNPAHQALAEMEHYLPSFTLITQNVDGLHQRAGSGKRFELIELHGNIQRNKCLEEGRQIHSWPESDKIPPSCPHCGAFIRPDVVWFGEALPPGSLQAAWEAARACQIFFSIGTSGVVEPAASLPHLALQSGSIIVEINPDETPLTQNATYVFQGQAGQILPALVSMVWSSEPNSISE